MCLWNSTGQYDNQRLYVDNNSRLVTHRALGHIGRMPENKELVVVTARFLADGAPAYLTAQGTWTRALQEAAVRPEDEGESEATTRAKSEQRIVADPYTFRVARVDDDRFPRRT